MKKPQTLSIDIVSHIERTGDPNSPIAEICDSITINGKKIKIPTGCTVCVSKFLTK